MLKFFFLLLNFLLFFLPTPAHIITCLASAGEDEDHEINNVSKNKNKLVFNYESVTKMSSQCSLAVAFHFIQSCKLQVKVNTECVFKIKMVLKANWYTKMKA